MTKVIFNGTIQGLSGRIGNLIFRQLPNGTTVVSEAPPPKTRKEKKRAKLKRSPKQKVHNSRFREAVDYAKVAQVQPVYVELAAVTPMRTAYSFALSDWFNPPEIHRIERHERRILVEASDNIMVTKVQVTVLDDESRILEKGEAAKKKGNWWEYLPSTDGKTIVAEASDLAGNVTRVVA
jgi:hypothetical protein